MVTKSRKIRIYPEKNDLPRFRQYLGLSRYWYNKAIEYLQTKGTRAKLSEVRKIQSQKHPAWALDCPQRIREHAISDACKAVKNAKLKYKQGQGFQKVKFRSKKMTKQSFGFDAQSVNEGCLFGKLDHRIRFKASEQIKVQLEGTRIVKENNRWWVIAPYRSPILKPENQRQGVVALDPGVRTFLTYYSPASSGKIGEADFNRIYRLCLGLDKLMSKISKARGKQKYRMRKASTRLRCKIKDLIQDLHHKASNFLVRNFDIVLLPIFKTQNMASKLNHKTSRNLLTFAHYRFKEILKAKAHEYSCTVLDICEAYTSKTCSFCGKINNIGSKKVIKCSCGIEMDRDYNGARGILLRALTASSLDLHIQALDNC